MKDTVKWPVLFTVIVASYALSSRTVCAQGDVQATLQHQEQTLQQEIDLLNKSRSHLSGHVSAAFLNSLANELRAKQSSLVAVQSKLKRAGELKLNIELVTGIKTKLGSEVSADFLAALQRELAADEEELAELTSSDGTSPQAQPEEGAAPKPLSSPAPESAPKPATSTQPVNQPAQKPSITVSAEAGSNLVTGSAAPGEDLEVSMIGVPLASVEVTADKNGNFAAVLPCRLRPSDVAMVRSKSDPSRSAELLHARAAPRSQYLTRLLVGTDITAASSSTTMQDYFLDAFTSVAPGASTDGEEQRSLWIWADAKVQSIPSPTAAISASQISSQFLQQSGLSYNLSNLTAALQFVAGIQVKLWPPAENRCSHSAELHCLPATTLNFVAAGGAVTPFSSQNTINIFDNNQSIQNRYPQVPTDTTKYPYVAFESPERDRFFRQYYGGFRLMTFWGTADEQGHKIFPGMFDVTYGQDEAATRGSFRGGVLRLDGSFPMVHLGVPWLYIFGTMEMKLARHNLSSPLILNPAPVGTQPTASTVFPLITPPPDRDLYRIGVGIDVSHAYQALTNVLNKNKQSPPGNQTNKGQ